VIKHKLTLFVGCCLAFSAGAVELVAEGVSITVSPSQSVDYTRGYSEDTSTAQAGEPITFTTTERMVIRVNDEDYREKLAFTPLSELKKNNLRPYEFDLSPTFFDFSTLKVHFISANDATSRSCDILVLDSEISQSQHSQLLTSLVNQGIDYQIHKNYL